MYTICFHHMHSMYKYVIFCCDFVKDIEEDTLDKRCTSFMVADNYTVKPLMLTADCL